MNAKRLILQVHEIVGFSMNCTDTPYRVPRDPWHGHCEGHGQCGWLLVVGHVLMAVGYGMSLVRALTH
jgi:hypothetical protein